MKIWSVIIVCFLSGCKAFSIPDEAFTQAKDNAALCDNFVNLMDAGVTNREQEQNFIRANRRAWHAQNFALNNELLPPDVEAWAASKKLGLDNAPTTPATTPDREPTAPPDRRMMPQ
jgi:hypothetical protein